MHAPSLPAQTIDEAGTSTDYNGASFALADKRMSFALKSFYKPEGGDASLDMFDVYCFWLDRDTNLCDGSEALTLQDGSQQITWAGLLRGLQMAGTQVRAGMATYCFC